MAAHITPVHYSIVKRIREGFNARLNAVLGSDDEAAKRNQAPQWERLIKMLDDKKAFTAAQIAATYKLLPWQAIAANIGRQSAGGNDANFIAVKVVDTKLRQFVAGLACGNFAEPYAGAIFYNAVINKGRLSAIAQRRSLRKTINDDALADLSERIARCARVGAGTVSTQQSQVRELARWCGLSDHAKGSRNVELTLTDNALLVVGQMLGIVEKEEASEDDELLAQLEAA